jgi:hypothetical protein
MPRVRARQGQKIFLFSYTVETGSGAHTASYSVGIEDLSRGLRWPGREVGHSPPSRAEVKNECSYYHPYAFTSRTGTTFSTFETLNNPYDTALLNSIQMICDE